LQNLAELSFAHPFGSENPSGSERLDLVKESKNRRAKLSFAKGGGFLVEYTIHDTYKKGQYD